MRFSCRFPPDATHHANRFLVLMVILGHLLLGAGQASEPKSAATIEDVLKVGGYGAAKFSPDGRWLVYTLIPPYNELSDYSYGIYAQTLSGHQVYSVDLSHDDPTPLLQPGLNVEATNYLFGFSPDSERIVVIEHHFGQIHLIACVIGKNECVRFSELPDIRDMYVASAPWNERLVWTSDRTFVLPTRSRSLPGSELRSRAATGTFLFEQWKGAWRGDMVTASEMISLAPESTVGWPDGSIVEFNSSDGSTTPLAFGRYAGVRYSQATGKLAAAQVGHRLRPDAHARLTPAETHPVFDRRYALRIIGPGPGEVKEVPVPFNVDPNTITWSPDGRTVSVYGWSESENSENGQFYEIDVERIHSRLVQTTNYQLANNLLNPSLPWPLGPARHAMWQEGLVIFARSESTQEFDWYLFANGSDPDNLTRDLSNVSGEPLFASEEGIAVLAEDGAYWISKDGLLTKISPDLDGDYSRLHATSYSAHAWSNEFRVWSQRYRLEYENNIALVVGEPLANTDKAVLFLSFDNWRGRHPPLRLSGSELRVLDASLEADAAVYTQRHGAAVALYVEMRGRSPIQLAMINEHLNEIVHPREQTFNYVIKDPNGQRSDRLIVGCIQLPFDYDGERKYPILMNLYPVEASGDCHSLHEIARPAAVSPDLWVSKGHIYIRPALPLDLIRSEESPIGNLPHVVDQTIDALIEQGYADPRRVVLYGSSQGGILPLYVAAKSKRISAVISMNGWANFLSHYFGPRGFMRVFHLDQNGGDNRWRYDCSVEQGGRLCRYGFGASALDQPQRYVSESPVVMARSIDAPVLLIHSDLDYMDMSQYDEMFGALYRAGKPVRYVRYWGEGHGPSSPANIRDMWFRIESFLREASDLETGHPGD